MSLSIDALKTTITAAERKRLTWNFDAGVPDYVQLPRGEGIPENAFIGVHLDQLDDVVILMQEGKWFVIRKWRQRDLPRL